MYLLLPIFKKIPIESGLGIRNIGHLNSFSRQPAISVRLWKNNDVVANTTLSFDGKHTKQVFLSDVFSAEQLSHAELAMVEFDSEGLAESEKQKLFRELFETQMALRSKNKEHWASVLYDMIGNKKPGHKYSPILHSAHAAYVSPDIETYTVLMNFRPPSFSSGSTIQKMNMEAKNSAGQVVTSRTLELPFNSTFELPFSEVFEPFGKYQNGCHLNFKGGESQFAIFTIFVNKKTQAFGTEHSLPPIYYCSSIYEPQNRTLFFKNALRGLS